MLPRNWRSTWTMCVDGECGSSPRLVARHTAGRRLGSFRWAETFRRTTRSRVDGAAKAVAKRLLHALLHAHALRLCQNVREPCVSRWRA